MHCCETKTLAALLLPLNVTLTLSAGVCVALAQPVGLCLLAAAGVQTLLRPATHYGSASTTCVTGGAQGV